MATNTPRPSPEDIDQETKAILEERLKTIDEDAKKARPAREVLADLRGKLKRVSPR